MSNSLNALLSNYSAEVQDLSLKPRELILSVVPGVQERVCAQGRSALRPYTLV
jgi:hypothetical protein